VEQEESIPAPLGLMVAWDGGARLPDEDHRAPGYGIDRVIAYPARIGQRVVTLIRRSWWPADGYSALGDEDVIVDGRAGW
jgi:hypothetical protein